MRFDDAKVLRSDETTLTQEELRILYSALESGENDIADLKKLTSVGNKIEASLGEYYTKVEAAIMAARSSVRSGVDPQKADAAVNLIVAGLDAQYGQALSEDVLLTTNEWQWLSDRWSKNNKFIGSKDIRIKILRIDEAVTNAKGVAFVGKNKAVWVQGEPEPFGQVSAVPEATTTAS